ncbi:MAG: hypothetical protein JOZ98_13950 [Solirubrobacterales bacterium]|nr:hypothetical protein [Solirubrobacterales bacterium]
MFSGDLNLRAAREHTRDLLAEADRQRFADADYTPVTRVTLRYASAADADRLRALAALHSSGRVPAGPSLDPSGRVPDGPSLDPARVPDGPSLDSARVPHGPSLVAEVDGRLRAALPLDGGPPIADPYHRGPELVELLRLRASQLA